MHGALRRRLGCTSPAARQAQISLSSDISVEVTSHSSSSFGAASTRCTQASALGASMNHHLAVGTQTRRRGRKERAVESALPPFGHGAHALARMPHTYIYASICMHGAYIAHSCAAQLCGHHSQ